MNKNLELRYILSYLGILPYLIILFDKTFFGEVHNNIINEFYIYYSLIIIVFVGAINWNLKEDMSNSLVLYGVLPSFFSVIIILLQIYSFNYVIITLILINFIFLQLILDFFFIYHLDDYNKIFFKLRLPLSTLICFCLIANLF